MRIGIIGKPNVGKSSFFKAATMANIEIQNYPFTTIKPNVGVAFVRTDCADKFFEVQCTPRQGFCKNHQRFVAFELVDVAGLVPGASEGKGLGNQFLDDLANVDALIHVIDASGSTNTLGEVATEGAFDPADDIRFIEKELDSWYYSIFMKGKAKIERQIKAVKINVPLERFIAEHFSGLNVKERQVKASIEKAGITKTSLNEWTDADFVSFTRNLHHISKPIIIAANKMDKEISKNNLEKLKKEFPSYIFIPTSALVEIQLKLAEEKRIINYIPGDVDFEILDKVNLDEKQKAGLDKIKNIMKDFSGTGVQETLNKVVFDLLEYKVIFPGGLNSLVDSQGRTMPDAFLMPKEATALDFAYKIHTDLGDHFIGAINVKERKKIGREAILRNGDVVEILTNK